MLNQPHNKRITPGGMLEVWLALSAIVLIAGVFVVDGAQQRNVAIVAGITVLALAASISRRRRNL